MKRILLFLTGLLLVSSHAVMGQLTAPFTESFNSASLPSGWVNNTSDPWRFTGAMGYDAGAVSDHTGISGSSFAWVDGSGTTYASAPLTTDSINMAALTVPELTFFLSSYNLTNSSSGYNTFRVDFYDGSSWHDSVYVHSGHLANHWNYVVVDLTPFTISGKCLIRFNVNTTTSATAFHNDIAIDDVTVHDAPPCPFPTGLNVDSTTTTTASLYWNPVNGGTGYEVLYGLAGFNPASGGSSALTTTDSILLTALTPGSIYQYYVIPDCGVNGKGDTAGPVSFFTLCVPKTSPDTNNFDNEATGAPALCWAEGFVGSPANQLAEVVSTGGARSLPNHLTLYNYFNTDTTMAISPQYTDLPAGDKQVSFYAKNSGGGNLVVGTMPNQTDLHLFQPLDTFVTSSSYGQEYIVYLDSAHGYNGTDEYIGFLHANNTIFSNIYIDDYRYEPIPPCPKPASLSVVTTGDTFAIISVNGVGNQYNFMWGPTGFNQGSPGTGFATGASPFTIDSLLYPGGTFDVYVRSDCGLNGVSTFTGPITFTTNCVTQSLPYVENFNINLGCMKPVSGGASPDTWEWEPAGGATVFRDLDGTGFAIVNSDEYGNGTYMREILESPPIDASNINGGLIVEFDQFYNNIGSDSATVQVYDGSQWHNVLTMHSDMGSFSNPDHQYINVTQYANANFQVRFLYDDGNVWAWYWLIDNFSVRDVQCAPSTNLLNNFTSSDSATFSWTPGTASRFLVEYGLTGFIPGTGFQTMVNDTFFNVGGLNPQTSYDIYIIDSCNTGFSDTLGPLKFTTSCLTQSLPYSENFNVDLGCMTPVDGGTSTDTWEWQPAGGAATPGDLDGTGFAGVDSDEYGNGAYMREMLVSPPIDAGSLPSTSALIVEWDQFYNWIGSDSAAVQVYDGSQWHNILTMHADYGSFNNPDHRSIDVTAYANANFKVRFLYDDGNVWAWYWLVDNFHVYEALCGIASNPDTLGVGIDTARLTWTSNGTNWNIMFGPPGFNQGTGTVSGTIIRNVTSNPYTLMNLTKSTCYDYYVQDTCVGIGSGPWAGPFTFCTKASCPAPTGLNASPLGATSATINWTPGGFASDYNVEYGLAGFTRGTGTTMNTTNPTVTLSSLLPNTTYDVYVRDSCGVGDVSLWTAFKFTTACTVIPAPYTTDLTAATVGHFNGRDNCWTIVSNNPGTTPDGGYSWEIRNTTQQTSSGTGPLGDNTIYPALGGKFITADVSLSVSGDSTMFISPLVNLSSVSSPYLEYYFHMYGNQMAELHVDIHNGTSWVRDVHVLTTQYQSSSSAAYKDTTIDLSAYSGQTVQVRFRAISQGCCAGDIALDDISLTGIPGCAPPTNLTVNAIACDSIEVSWNNAGDTALVAYAATGTVPAGATMVVNDSITYITGTMANTSYDFYVSNICNGDTSLPVGPITINTGTAGAPTASFTYNVNVYNVTFDASGSGGIGNTYTWDFGDTTNGNGANAAHTYGTGGTRTVTLSVSNNCGTDDTTITIAGISLEELAIGAAVSVYPNPASEAVYFDIALQNQEAVVVKLLSVNGKVITSTSYDAAEMINGQMDISRLADGVYMLKIETSKGSVNRRIVKQ